MNTHNWLRLVQIVVCAFWVGAVVFVTSILIPAIRKVGPNGGAVMREVMENRKLPIVMMLVSWITIISGGILAWRDAGALGVRWFERGAGLVFGLGATSAIMAMLVGLIVNMPAGRQMSALMAKIGAAGRAPNEQEAAQMRQLQDRLFMASKITAVLLLLATAFMATARNFG